MVIIDNEAEFKPDFDVLEIANKVVNHVLGSEGAPYETEVDILITDEEGIREYNSSYRDIDKVTDVLSFPNLEWDVPADWENSLKEADFVINPETNLVLLGEIALCKEKIAGQAEEYGHSLLREYAFLIAHSCLHLIGYDHMTENDAAIMEEKQKKYLNELDISR